MKTEYREFDFDINAEKREDGNVLFGRPIVYDKETDLGDFSEIIVSGALDNADMRDVRFIVNHDKKMIPLARSRRNNGNSTMFLEIVPEGLDIRVTLDTENNSDARALYSAVSRGDISGMSFMFIVGREEWSGLDSDYPSRKILEIKKIIEVSACTFPAYDQTFIDARSEESKNDILERAKKDFKSKKEKEEIEKIKTIIKIKSKM